MDIITQKDEIEGYINKFFKEYRIGSILSESNFNKEKGISTVFLLKFIFKLVFTGKNLYRFLQTEEIGVAKDSVYRFLNSCRYNWKKLLLLLSCKVIKWITSLTSEERIKVLILDDSLYSRSRSKAVELLARVYDHVEHKYYRGFRMLTVGWSDGATFMPLTFSLLSSENEENRFCEEKAGLDKRSNGYKRRVESTKKATEVLFNLLAEVTNYKVAAQYILFDSWFAYPSIIIGTLKYGINTICMLKDTPKIFYKYNGKDMVLNKIYNVVRKNRGKAKILASVIVELGRDEEGKLVKGKIVFVREKSGGNNWLALLSSDITLSEEEIIRIYGKRWDIEVFFKITKSYLKLAKEFQGRSYDAMIAHTTIVFLRYIMLSVEKRNNEDSRTIGDLFYHCCDEIRDIKFIEALLLLIDILTEKLRRFLYLPEKKAQEFMSNFISSLPLFIKVRIPFSLCES